MRHVLHLSPFPNPLLLSVEQTLFLSIAVELLVEVIHKAENMPVGMRVFESTRIKVWGVLEGVLLRVRS